MSNDNKNVNPESDTFLEYFKEDLDAIEEDLKKSKEYSEIIDAEIKKLSVPGLATKGTQHYLIEHITNAVQLQTQRQGLRKDKVAIKKLILDYANKKIERDIKADKENKDNADILNALKQFIDSGKNQTQEEISSVSESNIDSEIDNILEVNDKEDK